jgi:SAM-dependent methyltransferase
MDFANLAIKYRGPVATGYEERRVGRKWSAENEAVKHLIEQVAFGAKTLDVPVGTGRMLPFLKARGAQVYGLDVSPDMLAIAQANADAIGVSAQLGIGDIRQIPFDDGTFDLVSCLRFLNWIDTDDLKYVVGELVRVSRGRLLLGVRYLPVLSDLPRNEQAAVRFVMRTFGVQRFLANRSGLVIHRKSDVEQLFDSLNLAIVEARVVERRCDGTDYVFFLLERQ